MLAPVPDKLDCFARVITPENVEFEYALAGPFQRLPAFLIDFLLRALILMGVLLMFTIFALFAVLGGNIVTLVLLLTFFLMSWFYGIFFEVRYNGRTPGKMAMKLRVISIDGRPINATQAALRNLLRLADMCVLLPLRSLGEDGPMAYVIPTLCIGFVSMSLTRRMQRVGDLAAGTMVISEAQLGSLRSMVPEDARAFGLAELIPATFSANHSLSQAIGHYMESRLRLSPTRRVEVSKHLAEPLIQRFELLPDTSPDLLLCALYTRIFLSAEERERGLQQLRSGSPATPSTSALGPSL
jgi:uncharacterized RDD family membrane protein YckC